MLKNAVFLLTIFVLSLSCSDRDDNLTGVQIRMDNRTSINFNLIQLEGLNYEDVASGSSTFYQEYTDGISPRFIQITTDSLTHSTTIGTTELDSMLPGLYTYKLNSFSENEGMQFEVIED